METEQRRVLHNLTEAHVQAYNKIIALDDIDADGDGLANRVGFSHLMMEVIPAKLSKILGITTKNNTEATKNFSFIL